jgi:hypothetical protein
LNSNTLSAKRSPKQAGLNSDISQTHGPEFFRGMLEARSNEPAALADALTRVSQAALRVSDFIFPSSGNPMACGSWPRCEHGHD